MNVLADHEIKQLHLHVGSCVSSNWGNDVKICEASYCEDSFSVGFGLDINEFVCVLLFYSTEKDSFMRFQIGQYYYDEEDVIKGMEIEHICKQLLMSITEHSQFNFFESDEWQYVYRELSADADLSGIINSVDNLMGALLHVMKPALKH